MKPETSKQALLSFFSGVMSNIADLPTEKLGFGESPSFTDLQVKQLFIPSEGKWYYCLNFALLTEKEDTRKEILFLLQMLIDQALGRKGQGYKQTERKLKAYIGRERIA